jgi:hypothetical protein
MMYLQLEGATIEELRAQAILALDLRIQTAPQGEAKVADLIAENNAAADAIVAQMADTTTPGVGSQFQAEVEQEVAKAEPKKRGPRKAKAEQSITELVGQLTVEPAPKKLDLDAVKDAFSQYSQKFGVAAAQEDGPILLDRIFGAGAVGRIRDVPVDDQIKLARLIASVDGAIMTNEFKRDVVQ